MNNTKILQYDETSGHVVPLGATLRDAATSKLQSSLNALAALKNNKALNVANDGVLGPKTVAAVNLAIKTYAPNAKVQLPLNQTQVDTFKLTLSKIIEDYIKSEMLKGNSKVTTSAPSTNKESVIRLQAAIKAMWPLANNRALDITVDGIFGNKTLAAINEIFAKYIKAPIVMPMTSATALQNIAALALIIETKNKELKQPAKKAVTAQAVVDSKKQANPTQAQQIDKAQATALQMALGGLGKSVGNNALKVTIDGVIGPKTVAATNLALTKYVGGVNAALKSGKLTQKDVLSSAAAITVLIQNETNKRLISKPPTKATSKTAQLSSAENAADSAKERLKPETVSAIENTVEAAADGDKDAEKKLAGLAMAENSPDPETALTASDAMDVARGKAADIEIGEAENIKELTPYLDERTIAMPSNLIEDPAELGAHIGLVHELGETGFSLKKIGKGIAKGTSIAARATGKAALKAGKVALTPAMALLQINKIILTKIAIPIAMVVCKMPRIAVEAAALSANVNPQTAVMFCQAIRIRNMSGVRRMLPDMLKIAVKLSATGAAPGLAQVLNTIKLIPSPIRRVIPGISIVAGWSDTIVGGDCGCY